MSDEVREVFDDPDHARELETEPLGVASAKIRVSHGDRVIECSGPLIFVHSVMRAYPDLFGVQLDAEAPPSTDGPETASGASEDAEPVDSSRGGRFRHWYGNLAFPEGRTWKRDHVLAFIFYATVVEGQGWASPGTIRWCFEQLGEEGPKALTQMIINIRKHENWIAKPAEGTRGKHTLTKYGKRYVEKFVRS